MRARNERLSGSSAGDGRARETPLPTSVDPPRCGACAGLGLRMRRGVPVPRRLRPGAGWWRGAARRPPCLPGPGEQEAGRRRTGAPGAGIPVKRSWPKKALLKSACTVLGLPEDSGRAWDTHLILLAGWHPRGRVSKNVEQSRKRTHSPHLVAGQSRSLKWLIIQRTTPKIKRFPQKPV